MCTFQNFTKGSSFSEPLAWPYQTFTVNSMDDLQSMQRLLSQSVLYFERDLTLTLNDPSMSQSPSVPAAASPSPSSSTTMSTPSVQHSTLNQQQQKATAPLKTYAKQNTFSSSPATTGSSPDSFRSQDGHNVSTFNSTPTLPWHIGGGGSHVGYNKTSTSTGDSSPVSNISTISSIAQLGPSVPSEYGNVRSWGLERINQVNLPLVDAFNPGADGTNVHIFVLDTGVRGTHQDFTSPTNRMGDSVSIIGSSWDDDNGHGTFVAATAAGYIHGVARNATLHAVKVLDSSGSGSYSDIISGLGWVSNYVSNHGIQSAVVSMSLSGDRSQALNDAVESLIQKSIQVVAAAGNNNGGDACAYSPSSAPDAFTVAATTINDQLATYSNVGSCVYTFAPGTNIVSAGFTSDTAEVIMSGTSMSTPHVAGAIALYLQYNPHASVAVIKAAISKAADVITFSSSSPSSLVNVEHSRLFPSATQSVSYSLPPPLPPPPLPPPLSPPPPTAAASKPSSTASPNPSGGLRDPPTFSFSIPIISPISPFQNQPSWCNICGSACIIFCS
ncbi:hypothetical protein CEUSTIGMA_g4162.t1 [Chlamydomonas eustigma]|uniref:Peptidase S8/S53 domain-containing protein n=1 Tax=Chlamydomonas eustigma TaxID=1157962 RepID=A0A250X0Z0_9CHLO|nr:hypothetical protein CEUSTIGMA_g4162.t1 [Chlamydomonas eustigma]|eukprot:GAX76716.1 hypothetical protein CEUSTIGMA_g4162.t1 [Chlamydomonas eustigma]